MPRRDNRGQPTHHELRSSELLERRGWGVRHAGPGHRRRLRTALIAAGFRHPWAWPGFGSRGRPPSPSTRARPHPLRRPPRHRRLSGGRRGGHQQRPALFSTVGLPHGAVKEGRERVSAALANAGFEFPLRRITVNLAPADIRKDGSAFDLPIALGDPGGQRSAALAEPLVRHARGRRGGTRGRPAARPGRALHGAGGPGGRLRRPPAPRRQPAGSLGGRGPRGPRRAHAAARSATTSRGTAMLAATRSDLASADGRTRGRRGATSPMSGARRRPSARSRWPRPAATISCSSGRPVAGKTMLARRLPTILPVDDARRGARDHQDPQRRRASCSQGSRSAPCVRSGPPITPSAMPG